MELFSPVPFSLLNSNVFWLSFIIDGFNWLGRFWYISLYILNKFAVASDLWVIIPVFILKFKRVLLQKIPPVPVDSPNCLALRIIILTNLFSALSFLIVS